MTLIRSLSCPCLRPAVSEGEASGRCGSRRRLLQTDFTPEIGRGAGGS